MGFLIDIEKVVSPVVFLFADSEKKQYENGKVAAVESSLVIDSVCAEGGTIVVKGKFTEDANWIKEQIERTGVEPNLFDGV